MGVVPRCSHTDDMLPFHPTRGGSVLPLILDHATIAKAGAGTKLQPITERVIRIADFELRKSRCARQANAHRTWGKPICRVCISSQASEPHMLFPCEVGGEYDGIKRENTGCQRKAVVEIPAASRPRQKEWWWDCSAGSISRTSDPWSSQHNLCRRSLGLRWLAYGALHHGIVA